MWKLLRIWDYFIIVSAGRDLFGERSSPRLFQRVFLRKDVSNWRCSWRWWQDGWKAIFKGSILIMQEFEEQLLDMSFEMMLSQMPNLQ